MTDAFSYENSERALQEGYCSAAVRGIIHAPLINLGGILVVGPALFMLLPWYYAICPILLRLFSIIFTHINARRMQKALADDAELTSPIARFELGAIFVGLSWASTLLLLQPAQWTTPPGTTIVAISAIGIAMTSLIIAPLRRGLLLFLISYFGSVILYVAWYFADFGFITLATLVAVIFATTKLSFLLSHSAHETVRTKIENALLNQELQLALAEAERLSHTDELTGLANRRAFEDHVHKLLSRDPDNGILLLADLDHFKRINDEAGHAMGDNVLRAVGKLLSAMTVASGFPNRIAARIGGEEFAIFIGGTDIAAGQRLAEDLRRAIGGISSATAQGHLQVSVSVGVARRLPGESLTQLQKRADEAMYEAKNGGRDQVRLAA
ncbi:GGDEF domain-containing protein [Parasphingorhabdus sp.]|uniref:GGDEF domain-containing protein n=1 Tax=Parasphingorhabdus sp. TaxID=2709688 RepID=UPI003A94694C